MSHFFSSLEPYLRSKVEDTQTFVYREGTDGPVGMTMISPDLDGLERATLARQKARTLLE